MVFEIICCIDGILNVVWKYKMTGKTEVKSSWFWSALDASLMAGICCYLSLYQLAAFEVFFAVISILKLKDRINGMHISILMLVITGIYILDRFRPLAPLQLVATGFFSLCVYFLMNQKKFFGFLCLGIGNSIMIYVLYDKHTYHENVLIFLIFQIISLPLAIRGMLNNPIKKT